VTTKLGAAERRKRIAAAAEHLRALGRHAPGWQRTDNPDGTVDFHAADGEHLFTIGGMWARPVADYLDALHPMTGVGLAETLAQIGAGHDPTFTAAGAADRLLRTSRRVDET
jgi:hypothetical protein